MTTMGNRERQVHGDLLDQVADSTEERDNVRRVLGRALTERELDAANAERWASVLADRRALVRLLDEAGSAPSYHACTSGPCQQGRKLCPSPQACQAPEPGRTPPPRGGDVLRVVALFLAAWAAVATVLLAAGWHP